MSTEPENPTPETPPHSESAPTPQPAPESVPGGAVPPTGKSDKKLIAGLLAILLGSLGIHKFYLGYQKEGIIMLVVSLVAGGLTCGAGPGLSRSLA